MLHRSKVMIHELSKSHEYMCYSSTITVIFITDAKHTIRYSLRRRHITGTPCSWVPKRYISTNIICILKSKLENLTMIWLFLNNVLNKTYQKNSYSEAKIFLRFVTVNYFQQTLHIWYVWLITPLSPQAIFVWLFIKQSRYHQVLVIRNTHNLRSVFFSYYVGCTVQKMKFSFQEFCSKYNQLGKQLLIVLPC